MFWGGVLLLIQQVERIFLVADAGEVIQPGTALLLKTFLVGIYHDLTACLLELALAALLAVPVWLALLLRRDRRNRPSPFKLYTTSVGVSLAGITLAVLGMVMVDMGYYRFSHQHLNFVFFEYVADLWQTPAGHSMSSQAAQQTSAELDDGAVWASRVAAFLVCQIVGILLWRRLWRGLSRLTAANGLVSNGVLAVFLLTGGAGAAPPLTPAWLSLDSAALASLSDNPVVSALYPAGVALLDRRPWGSRLPEDLLSLDEAVALSQQDIGGGTLFPDRRYPLVHPTASGGPVSHPPHPHVVVIFVEGLDRRFVGRTVSGIQVTPFLDGLTQDSIYFKHFFTNGVQTSRGLFATLCSYYPRHGTAAIKTRAMHNYLCLPTVLRAQGYETEMVVGQAGTVNNLRPFFTRNGVDRFFDIEAFPPQAERMGLGVTDGAMFDFIAERIRIAQRSQQSLFLAALTLSTHHPFLYPKRHPDVHALAHDADQYLPALRYFDAELDRFFTTLRAQGLLANTMVVILGDHGRHEPQGTTDLEHYLGHFMAPLVIWLDDSLRTPATFRPRTVEAVASQVDIAPTIVSAVGIRPVDTPFVGRDMTCAFIEDCLPSHTAYLSSVYDDVIGLASAQGVWLYSFRRDLWIQTTLDFQTPVLAFGLHAADRFPASRHLLGLYLASNMLLEQNRIWSGLPARPNVLPVGVPQP